MRSGIERVALVIFDMDGLMFDTERLSMGAWIRAGEQYGYPIDTAVIMKAIGMNAVGCQKVFQKCFGDDFPLEKIRKLKSEYASEEIARIGVPVKPGLYDLLKFLELRSVPKAVATSTSRAAAEGLLQSAGILDRFDTIVCGDEVSEGKPHPEIFRTVAGHLGCDPKSCVVLEDSENGILAASRANMIPFLVPDLKVPAEDIQALAHRSFKDLSEVIDYLNPLIAVQP